MRGRGAPLRVMALACVLHVTTACAQDMGAPVFTLTPEAGAPDDLFGFSAAADPAFLALGAYGQDTSGENTGAVYVYHKTSDTWNPAPVQLHPPNPHPGMRFGWATAVADPYLAVGAPEDHRAAFEAGAVYLFQHETAAWTRATVLTASNALPGDEFGSAVAMDSEHLIVGAPGSPGSIEGGAAYIFARQPATGAWTEQARLVPDDVTPGDAFGWAVALHGDLAVVGALYHGRGGAAYVFQQNGTAWRQAAKLTLPDEAPMDLFGYAVATTGTLIAIGAPNRDRPGTSLSDDAGAVYIYTRDGETWALEATLTPEPPEPERRFGHSLDMAGPEVLIGARYASATADRAGAVSWYRRTPEGWVPKHSLVFPDTPRGYAGHAVALDGATWAFAAAPWTDEGRGKVYAYTLGTASPTTPDVPPSTAPGLAPVFPQPARDVAHLTLHVDRPQHVRVTAYDLLGRAVAVLFDARARPGSPQAIRFNTRPLPAGPYVVRAVGTTFTAHQTVFHTGPRP